MEKCWCLAVLLLCIISTVAALSVGGGVGIDVGIGNAGGGGGGGGGVWIGGGINSPLPSDSGSSVPSLTRAYTALQAWKSAIKEDPLRILDTWVGSDVCSYKGVFCAEPQDEMDASPGRLVAGTLPDTFRYLYSLQELDLSNNLFSGPFPVVTLYIPNLIYLDLRFNEFSGSIPDDLFNKKLDAIFLNNNQFEGQLPQNLANSPASVINLANNKFSGSIPISFGFMGSNLKEILFLNNQLTGCIPEGVGLFTEMQVLDVSSNSLMGHLPDTMSCMENMEVLNLAHNELSGVVPDPVCSLKSLVNLTVAYNFFSGFSQQCNKLFFRNVGFDFSANCVPGKNMQRPQPECSLIPGGGLNCLRIPLVCGSIGVMAAAETRPNSSSSSSSP
ncbi:hypothetical protein CIPAW_03G221700 [Carya illinoinensis]|uniref:Cell wall hydroxyproline-rich glycoprotein n=1 Tax=Carya illinoinensis TaxID=32201 RepID=A0A8T1R6Y9_CARIL|nr:hypothetical protein CIPAW_03G221700 [Carya illinoinensis]